MNVQGLLWEYDLDGVEALSELPDAVVERVMTRGGWAEMGWLIRELGAEQLLSFLERRGARVLPPRDVAFWGLACSAPEAFVRDWINDARSRQEEWRG